MQRQHRTQLPNTSFVFPIPNTRSPTAPPTVLFEPLDFIARLAALVPRPRVHLLRYHGLFAPNAKHRDHIITRAPPTAQCAEDTVERSSVEQPKRSSRPVNGWRQVLAAKAFKGLM